MSGVQQFVDRVSTFLIEPLIYLLFVMALALFLWGAAQFLFNLSGGDQEKEEGRKHLLWGIIGMFLMFSSLAILRVFIKTFGL